MMIQPKWITDLLPAESTWRDREAARKLQRRIERGEVRVLTRHIGCTPDELPNDLARYTKLAMAVQTDVATDGDQVFAVREGIPSRISQVPILLSPALTAVTTALRRYGAVII